MVERIKNLNIDSFLLGSVYLSIAIAGWLPGLKLISNLGVIGIMVYLFFKDKLHEIAPMFILFNSSTLYLYGIAISDLFYIIYIIYYIVKRRYINFKFQNLLLIMFIVYTLLVVINFKLLMGFEICLSLLFCLLFLNDMRNNNRWNDFCKWYIVGIYAATILGIKMYIDGYDFALEGESIRYMMTYTDPNYAGMFLSIGLYILIFLKSIFPKKYRIFSVILCVISILLTMSSSAILCNIVVVLIMLISKAQRKINIKMLFKKSILFIISMCVITGVTSLFFPNAFRSLERYQEKVQFLKDGELGKATTERSDIWNKHLNYYFDQESAFKLLFGGNYITDRGYDEEIFTVVSHNVYIDSLLCFGFIGTIIYIIVIVSQLRIKWVRRNNSSQNYLQFIICLIWIIYSTILSMFPFWAFIFFLLVSNEEAKGIENKKFYS